MGGYTVGDQNSGLTENFDVQAKKTPLTPAQEMGMGPAAYAELARQEQRWQASAADPNRSLISPMEMAREQNAQLQQTLKCDDMRFIILMKEESDFRAEAERTGIESKSSPVFLERMRVMGAEQNAAASQVLKRDMGGGS